MSCANYTRLQTQNDAAQAGRLIEKGEAKLEEYQHPDPYIGARSPSALDIQLEIEY